jgi:hypothetical protein
MTYIFLIGLESQQQSKIVREVCLSIWSIMRPDCIPKPTKEHWELIDLEFERRAHFSHCLQFVDGKHFRVIKPEHSGSMFYNYKDFFLSVVLMVVTDTNYRSVYVDIGRCGKDCESTVFKRSKLRTTIQTNTLVLLTERPLAGTEGPNVPYFFVGDEGFALNRNILRPFGGSNLTFKKRVYIHRLCRAQKYVDCVFGILSNKCRNFQRPLNVSPDFAVDIVKACIVAHNFICERDDYKFEDALTVTGLEDVPDG